VSPGGESSAAVRNEKRGREGSGAVLPPEPYCSDSESTLSSKDLTASLGNLFWEEYIDFFFFFAINLFYYSKIVEGEKKKKALMLI